MESRAFSASDRETSHEYGTPTRNIDDIPIDPALGGPQIDPQLTGEQPVPHFQTPVNPDMQPAQQTEYKFLHQYSDAPSGDPFAPQPEQPPYEQPPPPQSTPKATKRKRKGRREAYCHHCKGDERENKKTGEPEFMLCCEDCGLRAHPTCVCLHKPEIVRSYPWKCADCKACETCGEKGDDSRMLFCDRCDRGWHCDCLDPPLQGAPEDAWYCPMCHDSMSQLSDEDLMNSVQGIQNSGKGKARAVPIFSDSSSSNSSSSESDEDNANGQVTAPVKRRGRKPRDHLQSIEVATPKTRRKKRQRTRITQSVAPPPTIRIRLKRGEEEQKGQFDDILTPAQRDISKTAIIGPDKQRFDRTKTIADTKLAVQASSAARDSEQPEAGPSRPLRFSTLQQITTTASSLSPAPSTPGAISLLPLSPLRIQTIRFGQFDIKTWYDAPFPEEYANIPDARLWFCEFCLKYMKSRFGADRHRMKCKCRHPPGDEIYRDGQVSIFEVDGRKNKIYCQNLCLLSKMFLDHKSLFYDVEPFLFYVITEVNDSGAHFVGYFSKEKRSPKDYNVSCIMTLPVRQRRGWGNLLIDFSYLLSKKEQRLGSPEKPLSGLGAIGYKNYWTLAVMRYLQTAPDHPRLEDISLATSMTLEDVHVTLTQQDMITVRNVTPPPVRPSPGQTIKYPKGRKNKDKVRRHLQQSKGADKPQGPFAPPTHYDITWDKEKVDQYLRNWEAKGYIRLKPEKLKWSPFIISRTQKTESLQAPATTDLTAAAAPIGNGNGDAIGTPGPSKDEKPFNGEADPPPHFRNLDDVEHLSDDELAVSSAISDKKLVAQLERDRILAEDMPPSQLQPVVPPPAKRPRGRPKKIIDPPRVEPKPQMMDSPRQLRSQGRSLTPSHALRKMVESSPGADGNAPCEPDELSNGNKTATTHAVAFPSEHEHDVKSEGSSTPLTNGQSLPSDDSDTIAVQAVSALLGLKGQMTKDVFVDISGASKKDADDADGDADGDYDDDVEMEDATRPVSR